MAKKIEIKKAGKPTAKAKRSAAPKKGAWRKASPELVERFERALPDDPRAGRRNMFGYPCAFCGGWMFAGLFEESVFVRLPEDERQTALASQGAGVFAPLPGRVMREYITVPPAAARDEKALRTWLVRALDHTASLPPKVKKRR